MLNPKFIIVHYHWIGEGARSTGQLGRVVLNFVLNYGSYKLEQSYPIRRGKNAMTVNVGVFHVTS
jgi:hypothetical protein